MKCPNCGKEANPNDKFCIKCGKPLEAHNYCNKCGAKLFKNQKFCNKCGAEVQVHSESSHDNNKASSIINGRTALLVIGIVLLIIIAAYFSNGFASESKISGKGFSAIKGNAKKD